jgi:formylglycine-generating enzyme required for sulfatase activity
MPGREMDSRPLTAIEAASQATRLVLLGDPGAGKSTFVRKLAGWQAAANASLAVEPPPGFNRQLLPVVIVLRDLVAGLGTVQLNNLSADKRQKKLADLVRDQALADLDAMECSDFAAELRQAFQDGQCLLILDGLDEVPYDLRPVVRETVTAVLACHQPKRTIVTCRVRSYTAGWTLPGFQEHTLAPLDQIKIRGFATAWYNAQKDLGRFTAGQAEARAADLADKALGADLRELAENPMLLTTMAIIHQKEIGLPSERVRLYSLAVDVLLRRWQKRKVGESLVPSPALARFLADDLRLRSAVERLAISALQVKRGDAADLPRGDVLALLEKTEYLGDTGLAHEFLDYVDQRAGLLVGRGGEEGKPATYSFPHRTFQEYLAGCYLAGLRDVGREYYARAAEGDYYSLAARLGAEELWYNRRSPNVLLDLAYHLCAGSHAPRSVQERRAVLWSGFMAAMVGRDEVARDTGNADGGEAYLDRLIPRLEMLLRSDLTPVERADAGVVLGRLGDPRREVMTIEGMPFCLVPAGPFWMGSGDKEGYGDERPQHVVELPDYWISRYPVTNAQYAAFVQAGGYDEAACWPEAEAAGYWQAGQGFQGPWDNAPRLEPAKFGEPFDLPNHPVVGVSWYEVLAFSRWLSTRVGRRFTLPSEAEWEKAARGGPEVPATVVVRELTEPWAAGEVALQSNPKPRRAYPWEDGAITPERANFADTRIGSTSAAGCFPAGASRYGAEEMAGNVWEWTRSLRSDGETNFAYPYDAKDGRERLDATASRVLRGGSWIDSADGARCAYRGHGRSEGPPPQCGFPARGPRPLISEFSELCFTTRSRGRSPRPRSQNAFGRRRRPEF